MMRKFSPELIVLTSPSAYLKGAISAPGFNSIGTGGSMSSELFKALAKKYKFSLDVPFSELSDEVKDIIFTEQRAKR